MSYTRRVTLRTYISPATRGVEPMMFSCWPSPTSLTQYKTSILVKGLVFAGPDLAISIAEIKVFFTARGIVFSRQNLTSNTCHNIQTSKTFPTLREIKHVYLQYSPITYVFK